jgi:hypothetical protein
MRKTFHAKFSLSNASQTPDPLHSAAIVRSLMPRMVVIKSYFIFGQIEFQPAVPSP